MRFLKSLQLQLSDEYPVTDTFDLEVEDGSVIGFEGTTFYTPLIKLPFNGIIPVIQRFFEYGPDNMVITINGKNVEIEHKYVQAKSIIVNNYGDETFTMPGEWKYTYIDAMDIVQVYVSGQMRNVIPVLSNQTSVSITIYISGTSSNLYAGQVNVNEDNRVKSYESTDILFKPNYDSDHHVVNHTAVIPRFIKVYYR